MKITRRLRIHGQVQGVFFRESMRQRAEELGLTGWVRNRSDGTVEAEVQGEASAVGAIVEWARRGPPRAQVDGVDNEAIDGAPDYTGFDKRPSL